MHESKAVYRTSRASEAMAVSTTTRREASVSGSPGGVRRTPGSEDESIIAGMRRREGSSVSLQMP